MTDPVTGLDVVTERTIALPLPHIEHTHHELLEGGKGTEHGNGGQVHQNVADLIRDRWVELESKIRGLVVLVVEDEVTSADSEESEVLREIDCENSLPEIREDWVDLKDGKAR